MRTDTRAEDSLTDEELVRLVIAGQREVYVHLYERYRLRIYRLAWGMTGQREAAEDLTQEVFLRAYQMLGRFRGEASFGTWFYRLATNCCLNMREREQKQRAEGMEEADLIRTADSQRIFEVDTAEYEVWQQQLQGIVHKALLSLKPELRMVVILRSLEGLSYDEIAVRMNCSSGTVGTWLHRAHKLLAQKLAGLREAK